MRSTVLAKGGLVVAADRDGFSRGVLLVKAKSGEPVAVGTGY